MSSNSDNETQNAKNKLNKLEMDTLEEELRPKGVGDAVWEKLQEAKNPEETTKRLVPCPLGSSTYNVDARRISN